ncbi:LysR substrate-binding domain-containing protein, partial [Streptomyces palmae]
MDLLRHLRYFRAVAEELHFGRAAERLGMAQPPLSQRIRGLEEELGTRLFDRNSRGVRLTAAGEVLLAESEELLALAERLRTRVARAGRGAYGTLRVGVVPELPGRVLAQILTAFAAEAPEVRLELHETGTAAALRLLDDRELDTGLVLHPVRPAAAPDPGARAVEPAAEGVGLPAGLVSGPMACLPLGVVVPRGSPLAGGSALTLPALAGQPLVLFPRDAAPGVYDAMLRGCRAGGYRPASVVHATSPETMLALVIAGRGIALAHPAVARKEPRVLWLPLTGSALAWRMSFVRPAKSPHPAAERLAAVAATVLPATTPAPPAGPDRPT